MDSLFVPRRKRHHSSGPSIRESRRREDEKKIREEAKKRAEEEEAKAKKVREEAKKKAEEEEAKARKAAESEFYEAHFASKLDSQPREAVIVAGWGSGVGVGDGGWKIALRSFLVHCKKSHVINTVH